MNTHTYSTANRILYRYGNIPVTIILLVYLIPLIIKIDKHLYLAFLVLIIISLIYTINRHYLLLYKILPCTIISDNEKIICKDFFLSKKEIIIYYPDIRSLEGGVFRGKAYGLMKIDDAKNTTIIGFYNSIKDAQKLQTIILSNVKREVYDEVLNKTGVKKRNIQ